jgi:hypothetical protein
MITLIFIGLGIILYFIGQKASALLIVFGVIAKNLAPILLGFVGLPGRLIIDPDNPKKQNRAWHLLGILIITIAQSVLYFAYTAFIIGWTKSAEQKHPEQSLLWPLAILAVFIPIAFAVREFSKNANEVTSASKDMDEKLKQVIGNPANKAFLMLRNATIITLVLTAICFVFLLSK